MKKQNKKGLLFIIPFSFTILFISIFVLIGISIEKPLIVSKSVIESIYADNNFSYANYNDFINSKNNVDINITSKSLSKVKQISIDVNSMGNSDFFKYMNNLEVLTISNYQNLLEKDINNLKYLRNLKIININIDGKYVLKNSNYKIDLNIFPNLETVYISCNLDSEIDSYISYNILKNNKIKNIVFNDNISIQELEKWDNKINKIVETLDIHNKNDYEKTQIVSNYVMNYLRYDNDVYNYLYSNTSRNYLYKIDNYNKNLLKSILDNDSRKIDAICCNYAALTNILLYKIGIESYYVEGTINNSSHAWNLINIEGDYYYLDLTYIDNSNTSELFISCSSKEYKMNKKYDIFNEITKEDIIYYNTNTSKIIVKINNSIL